MRLSRRDLVEASAGQGTDRARRALQVDVQAGDEDQRRGTHSGIVPRRARSTRGTLEGMTALLTSRLHVDLQRVSSALCSRA